MSQRTQDAYNAWADAYDQDPNPHLALEHDDVLALAAPVLGESVLDAACGTGRYAGELARAGAKAVGIDFSDRMLAVARTKYPDIDFRKADLQKALPFSDGSFDCIVCGQALKHLPKLAPVLSEFARILRPEGRLVFSVTHPDMNWELYEMRDHPEFVLQDQSDIFHHRFADYFEAIEAAGLAIDRIKQIRVSEKIRPLLTEESYQIVKDRFQVVAFRLRKPKAVTA